MVARVLFLVLSCKGNATPPPGGKSPGLACHQGPPHVHLTALAPTESWGHVCG